jgi:hypothetical protein
MSSLCSVSHQILGDLIAEHGRLKPRASAYERMVALSSLLPAQLAWRYPGAVCQL